MYFNFRTICIKYSCHRVYLHNFKFANLSRNIHLVIFAFAFPTNTFFSGGWKGEFEAVRPFRSLVHTLSGKFEY